MAEPARDGVMQGDFRGGLMPLPATVVSVVSYWVLLHVVCYGAYTGQFISVYGGGEGVW
jgi:hypothetical protein